MAKQLQIGGVNEMTIEDCCALVGLPVLALKDQQAAR